MPRERRKGRMTFDAAWIGTPLLQGGGFDHLGRTLGLEPHAHKGFELTYISEGETVWVLQGGTELRLVGGSAALIQSDVVHHGKYRVIAPSRLFWLVFAPGAAGAVKGSGFTTAELEEIGTELSRAGNRVWRADANLRQSFELLHDALAVKCAGGKGTLPRALCRTASSQLIVSAVRSLGCGDGGTRGASLFEEARRLMSGNLSGPSSIPALAARLGVSAAFFSERFKAESGMTPGDYLRRMRCERACEMLVDARLTVTDIAFRLGFSTSQHFAEVFRRYVGMSPSQFRRNAAGR